VCNEVDIVGKKANKLAEGAKKFAELTQKDADSINMQIKKLSELCNNSYESSKTISDQTNKPVKAETESHNVKKVLPRDLAEPGIPSSRDLTKTEDANNSKSTEEQQDLEIEGDMNIPEKSVKKSSILSIILGGITGTQLKTSAN